MVDGNCNCHRFGPGVFQISLKLHIADIKNITGDDQVTLKVERNSATIAQALEIYAYQIVQNLLKFTSLLLGCRHPMNAIAQIVFILSLLFSATKKFLDDLDPTKKTRYTY